MKCMIRRICPYHRLYKTSYFFANLLATIPLEPFSVFALFSYNYGDNVTTNGLKANRVNLILVT